MTKLNLRAYRKKTLRELVDGMSFHEALNWIDKNCDRHEPAFIADLMKRLADRIVVPPCERDEPPADADVVLDLSQVHPTTQAVLRVVDASDGGSVVRSYVVPMSLENREYLYKLTAQLIELYAPNLFLDWDASAEGLAGKIESCYRATMGRTNEPYLCSLDDKLAIDVLFTDGASQFDFYKPETD